MAGEDRSVERIIGLEDGCRMGEGEKGEMAGINDGREKWREEGMAQGGRRIERDMERGIVEESRE